MKVACNFLLIVVCIWFSALSARAQNVSSGSKKEAPPVEAVSRVYKLSPNDVIEMKVYQEDDLTSRVRIAQDGTVNLPLIGVINVEGKTVEQAATAIKDLYEKDYLVNAQINITVGEYSKRRFTILGQVQKPGSFEIPSEERLTLVQAIALAGGFTRIGSPSKVTVQRKEGNETKIFKLDAEAMAKDKNAKPFEIRPEDTITVGEKWL